MKLIYLTDMDGTNFYLNIDRIKTIYPRGSQGPIKPQSLHYKTSIYLDDNNCVLRIREDIEEIVDVIERLND